MSVRPLVVLGLSCLSAACAPATPDAVQAPARRKLVQTFALHHADETHDVTETADAASLPTGIRADRGFFTAADADALHSFVRSLRAPPGDTVLVGAGAQGAARTYLVQSAPVLGDAAIASSMPATQKGAAGIILTFTPDGYERLYSALGQKSTAVVVVQGRVEPGSLELLDDGSNAREEGQPPPPPTCVDRSAFLPLTPRDGVTAEAHALAVAAAFPPAPAACQEQKSP